MITQQNFGAVIGLGIQPVINSTQDKIKVLLFSFPFQVIEIVRSYTKNIFIVDL